MHRLDPLGVKGDVVCGHGFAGEVISRTLAQLVVVPTSKLIAYLACGSSGRVVRITDILLIFLAESFIFCTAVDEDNVVAVTGVVESSTVILFIITIKPVTTLFRCIRFKREAGNGVSILISDAITGSGSGITVMKLVFSTSQGFYIVVSSFAATASFRPVEISTT